MARSLNSATAFDMTGDARSFSERQAKEARRARGFELVDVADGLVDHPDNRPIKESAVKTLALDIERHGLAQAICVREIDGPEPPYQIISGHHRVRAYRYLKERHPETDKYDRIEAKVVSGMDDDTADSLLRVTNFNLYGNREENGRLLLDLYQDEAERIRDERGGSVRRIIAELYEETTGQHIGEATVARSIQAAKSSEKKIVLADCWNGVGLKEPVAAMMDELSREEQEQVFALWDSKKRSIKWLTQELKLRTGRGDRLCMSAFNTLIDNFELLQRCSAAGYEIPYDKYQAAMQMMAGYIESLDEEGTDVQ